MRRSLFGLFCTIGLITSAPALAWSPLRSENSDVKRGNTLMTEGRPDAALEAYDAAAAELPDSKGVQLNRGLAFLAQDLTEQAKEPFLAAADPAAPTDTRADAYYDLGVAFARQGDALAQQEDHEQATASFQEAVDAFKRALRLRPGDRDAAWNLEYAMQRIREQEEQQEQQQQGQEDGQEDTEEQEQEQEQQEGEEQQEGDEQQQEQQQGQGEDQEQEDGQEGAEEQEQEQQAGDGQEDEPEQGQEQGQEQQAGQERQREQAMQQNDVQRFLDALEQNEESLPVERARRQSAGRRPPEKDW